MSKKYNRPEVPQPADPIQRKESLPWQKPKPSIEDPASKDKLKAILNSPSYVSAIEDVDFLDGEDARGVRLQLDYLKPDRLLKEHGIENTIVVFGSTRIVEPAAAEKRVKHSRMALAKQPDDKELKRKLLVAERILAKSHYYEIAREFSQLVANAGDGPRGFAFGSNDRWWARCDGS